MIAAVAKYGMLPAALVVCLGTGVQAQQQTETPAASPAAPSSGSASRDGSGCYRDLSELDTHFEENGLSARARTAGAADPQKGKQKFESLREAARTLAANGRYDACRMLVYEIRAIWDHDQSPMGGTNSP